MQTKNSIFLTAQWQWLVLVNYKVPPELLYPFVPKGVELDTIAGQTFVSLVGFIFTDTRLRGWRIPCHVNFEELNLRFYVVRRTKGEVRRGVVFIKELVPRIAIAQVARRFYNENYSAVPMRHTIACEMDCGPHVKYEFKSGGRWNSLCITSQSTAFMPAIDSHEAFLLEHYWGYTTQRDGGTIEYRVDHPRWNVWASQHCEVDCDFKSLYGAGFVPFLEKTPYSAFVAEGSPVSVAKPSRIA